MTEPRITELNIPELIDSHALEKIRDISTEMSKLVLQLRKLAAEKMKLEVHYLIGQAMK